MVRLSHILSIAMLVVHLMVGCCAQDVYGCESKHPCSATHSDADFCGEMPGVQMRSFAARAAGVPRS